MRRHAADHHAPRGRFVFRGRSDRPAVAGAGRLHAGDLSYRRLGDVLVLHHTEVPRALQGQGLAAELVQAVLDWARTAGLRVRPTCSYVAAYMRRHPETQDLLENDHLKPSET